jgi:histidine ammonia-lyase
MGTAPPLQLRPGGLSVEQVVEVARHRRPVTLAPEAVAALTAARDHVQALAIAPEPAYGISTGFGALATVRIPPDRRRQLQRSLVRSHAAGSGPPVEDEVVRAMVLLRLRTLAMGHSGARPVVAHRLAWLLDAGVTPLVPEHGSLGCSGDLAPLAHVALALVGEGEVRGPDGVVRAAADVLAAAGLEPLELEAKEGLALLNGTDGMLGMLCLALVDLDALVRSAEVAAAMSVEALLGTDRAFAADLLALRPQPGQAASARNLSRLLAGSPVLASHRDDPAHIVQDAYSLRCAPQVAGAVRDTAAHARAVAGYELAAAIDNPVVLSDGRVASNGNFHGAPLGYVLDFLAIAAADLASIAERRVDRMLDPTRSHGLPPFLAHEVGVDSGLMIAQYTAAALVAECRRLAVPASVDSIPSSAMQEDHVSMGWAAARKLRRSLDALGRVVAIEVLTAARALDLRAPLQPGPATAAVRDAVRAHVPGPGPDRPVAPELEAVVGLVGSGSVLAAAESVTGRLE